MTEVREIDLDALSDYLTLTVDGDPALWPAIRLDLTVRWHAAEPDVGIFSETPEITGVEYNLDGETMTDEDAFIATLYQRIGDEIEESQDALALVISKYIEEVELEND